MPDASFVTRKIGWQRVLATACGAASIAVAAFALALVKRMTVDVPFWDEWEWTRIVVPLHHGIVPIADLWQQHNEHRMFFPGLIVLALDKAGGWSQVRECLTSVALTILSQLIILALLRSTFRRNLALPLLLIDSFLLFSPSQSENLIWGFQIAWFLINAAVLGTVWLLSRPTLNVTLFAAAAVCAVIASYSLALGLNALLVGLVILLLRPDAGRAAPLGWIVLSTAVTAFYLVGFHSVPSGPAQGDSFRVWPLVEYFFSYLGLPLGRSMGLPVSITVGIVVFGAFVASTAIIARTPRCDKAAFDRAVPWFGLAAFALATAVMTALGRVHFGLEQSLASRYETEAAIFWIATVALCADALVRARALQRTVTIRALALLTLGGAIWLYQSDAALGIEELKADRAVRLGARSVLALGNEAPNAELASIYPSGELLRYYMHELKAVHDGPPIGPFQISFEATGKFPPSSALGPVAGSGAIDHITWQGEKRRQSVLSDGQQIPRYARLEISGWAADPAASVPAQAIVAIRDGSNLWSKARVAYGIPRPDVVHALGHDLELHTGYRMVLNTDGISPGPHTVTLGAVTWDGLGYYTIGKPIRFVISPARLPTDKSMARAQGSEVR